MSESIRIAVASSDGIVVNQHFGRARSFYVYQVTDKKAEFVEKRIGRPFCHGGEHDDGDLQDAIDLLSDCKEVYVLEIGAGAEEALKERGLQSVKYRGLVEKAVLERAENYAGTLAGEELSWQET
ncbi:MAG: dinitrogenase iron-molybdenum cofactor biosynthesis protein [Lachnospiraceae bacterium]|nr:dinitrogenase iron-molybdenum cofactor biosynthesis protein [Lachnospiraceae bacterium]MBO7339571.1 dinitrogenase iron-molybdenum cofactor biosynthesis protein [Lachnospiraceae bacterium]